MSGSGLVQQCTALLAFCRSHFYKIVGIIVLTFLLMQYATNVLVNNHSMPKTVSPGLSWMSALSVHRILGVQKKDVTPLENYSVLPSVKLKTQNELTTARTVSVDSSAVLNRTIETGTPAANYSASSVTHSSSSSTATTLPLCPVVPPKLVGRLKVLTDAPSFEELEKIHRDLEPGGRFQPKNCKARSKVAIIIPYRDREEHLRIFLHNLHPMLQRQQLDYGIYIVEEMGKTKFNRAMLMNIGYVEALKQYEYECFMFHDVDLIPEDDRNLYTCPEQPRHMSVAINSFGYRLPYKDLFGGVSALSRKHMEKVNGFSNEFWGWGGEDDDMSNRLRYHGLQITRYPANIARYSMLKHSKDDPNPDRYNKLYKGRKRFKTDGLNSLKYKRTDLVLKKLYTLVQVEIHPSKK